VRCSPNPFASDEEKFRESRKAATVFLIARETGWAEKDILNLPSERINTYAELVKKLYAKEE
jgi:hypothetical protein